MSLARFLLKAVFRARPPRIDGELTLAGLGAPLHVHRDRWGVAYIEAESEADAWFGLGFCQGQDRAFQLELLARVARGTLSEWVGLEGLAVDRLSRRIGFFRAARAQLAVQEPAARRILGTFAQGVTAGMTRGRARRPLEYALLRARPAAFEPADALAILGLLSFTMDNNWSAELARLRVLDADGPEALQALEPGYDESQPVTSPPGGRAGPAVERLAADLAALKAAAGLGGGSNNWALSPRRTATGRPILANDPHLPPTLPPHWYLAHVRAPGWAAAGAALVGAPGIAVGHNGTGAWGATAGMVDNTDLFIEELGTDGRSVREASGFVPCEVLEETIAVRGRAAVVETVLVTKRGPLIGPALAEEGRALSLRALWLDPLPLRGMLSAPRAKNFHDFRAAFEQWPYLPMNLAWADESGSIGWQLAGQAPKRRSGSGKLPMAAWDPAAGWDGEVPFPQMPFVKDPAEGFVASANNKHAADSDGPFLGDDWFEGYRMERICESLRAGTAWDVAKTLRLQLDQECLPWRELRDSVLAAAPSDPRAPRALALLRAWDGRVAADSVGAAVYEFFLAEMLGRLVAAKAPKSAVWALGKGATPLAPTSQLAFRRVGQLARLLRERPSGWFKRSWSEELGDALAATIRTLEKLGGPDPKQWAWGRLRPLTLEHPLGARKGLASTFNRGPFPYGGDTNTVAQTGIDLSAPTANPVCIPSLRAVIDVGNWDESRFVLPGGQSGDPFSPHYDDQLALWHKGEGIPIAWSPEAIDKAAVSSLTLKPS